jgi:hypothetical protein
MRSGEREQNSRRQMAHTSKASARSQPIALGMELAARGGGPSLSTVVGSSGQRQGAEARTARAGELQKANALHTVLSMRVMGQGQMRRKEGVGSTHRAMEILRWTQRTSSGSER